MTTIADIEHRVAQHHGLSVEEIESSEYRNRRLVRARWQTIWLARTRLRRSFPVIGRVLNKDQSSIRHAFMEMRDERQEWREEAEEIGRDIPTEDGRDPLRARL